jgi:hypothetical protein
MNFIEALKKCYDGSLIRKATWDEGSYLKYENDTINLHTLGTDRTYIYVAYMPDLLKTDWEIYEERQSKTYNFQEALEALNEGKLIRKLSDLSKENDRGFLYKEEDYIRAPDDYEDVPCDEKIFSYNDLYATDWLIVDRDSHPLTRRNE